MAKGRSAHAWGYALCPANAGDACRSGTLLPDVDLEHPKEPSGNRTGLPHRKGLRAVLMKDETDEWTFRNSEFDLMIALPAGERDEDAMLDALYEAGVR